MNENVHCYGSGLAICFYSTSYWFYWITGNRKKTETCQARVPHYILSKTTTEDVFSEILTGFCVVFLVEESLLLKDTLLCVSFCMIHFCSCSRVLRQVAGAAAVSATVTAAGVQQWLRFRSRCRLLFATHMPRMMAGMRRVMRRQGTSFTITLYTSRVICNTTKGSTLLQLCNIKEKNLYDYQFTVATRLDRRLYFFLYPKYT